MPAITPQDARPDVLIIDGSAASRYRVRQQLRALDARVHQAASVEHALKRLRVDPPDLIVMAPTLPGMNALDLLALLADDPQAPPVAIYLADQHWPLVPMATRLGAHAVLDADQLPASLPGLLARAGNRRRGEPARPAMAGQLAASSLAAGSPPIAAGRAASAPSAASCHCGRTAMWLAGIGLAFGFALGLTL